MPDKEHQGPPDPGDIGRRVALQRERLGLTREEAAVRAGMAPGYLEYLEKHPSAPSGPGLLRLAAALETSVEWLRGGGTNTPPGRGRAAGRPRYLELDEGECWARLSTHGVGRIAVTTADGPAIIPVNYQVVDGSIAFRTKPGSAPSVAVGHEAAFEVDYVDDAFRRGWSVLVVGRARAAGEEEARHLAEQESGGPWAGGERRDLWVVVRAERVTGRRIHTED
ncbi:pyridoxamine 5'-phosphate oxidase family protein [Streptomyces sp. CNQ085]|uniref:helix-turn-helix domain-containing protein n=1 Tax=Streptomyces sp. CNQ085 TaxID=2886944 RepID=UPI001F50DB12|nr:pyridoxamine 5'-phosphate oxidase family protein [Streptomyces sp. CNQ085]MCI0386774.1 pyridoxamine 5'-phosphate oxidase family protein [Streptomyces sp. CNQ085]